jgi:hypothetical protein
LKQNLIGTFAEYNLNQKEISAIESEAGSIRFKDARKIKTIV